MYTEIDWGIMGRKDILFFSCNCLSLLPLFPQSEDKGSLFVTPKVFIAKGQKICTDVLLAEKMSKYQALAVDVRSSTSLYLVWFLERISIEIYDILKLLTKYLQYNIFTSIINMLWKMSFILPKFRYYSISLHSTLKIFNKEKKKEAKVSAFWKVRH